jgi:hypothetical protein
MSDPPTSSPGYKLREKIGKALKSRAAAIKQALEQYNHQAALLNPPRPQLTWAQVIDMVSLAEFDILRDVRQDVRQLQWAQPAHRHATRLHLRVKAARDEITRLNVEIQRLLTFMFDDYADHLLAIQRVKPSEPHLAHELAERNRDRQVINECIVNRLIQTSRLPGFSGTLTRGVHRTQKFHGADAPQPHWAPLLVSRNEQGDGEREVMNENMPVDDEDEDSRNANAFIDFVVDLS